MPSAAFIEFVGQIRKIADMENGVQQDALARAAIPIISPRTIDEMTLVAVVECDNKPAQMAPTDGLIQVVFEAKRPENMFRRHASLEPFKIHHFLLG